MNLSNVIVSLFLFFSLTLTAMENQHSSINQPINPEQQTQIFFGTQETIPQLIDKGASIDHKDSSGLSAIDFMISQRRFQEAALALQCADNESANNALSKKTDDLFTESWNEVTEFFNDDEANIRGILYEEKRTIELNSGIAIHRSRNLTIHDWIKLFEIMASYYQSQEFLT